MRNPSHSKMLFGASVVALALGAGCEQRDLETTARSVIPAVPTAQGGGPATLTADDRLDNRLDGIADALCDYETRCGHVGTNGKYGDRSACIADQREQRTAENQTEDCEGGIDTGRMSSCLAAIRNNKCDDVVDTTARIAACRLAMLCLPNDVIP
jgi:hypothetical protein